MKFKGYMLFIVISIGMLSCKKDNYDAPSSTLSGKFVYKGEAIQVEYGQVPFQIYQYGFGKVGSIDGKIAQDGTYSALLFDGDYKFIVPNGQGPFLWKQTSVGAPDTVNISLKGSQTLDMEVIPFYMVRNAQFTAGSGKVSATCKVEKIVTDANAKDIENVVLYINKTQFVSGADNINSTSMAGSSISDPNSISLDVSIPAIVPTQNYVFARIGVKIAGVEDMIFSPVTKVSF